MSDKPSIIHGNYYADDRGKMSFINDFLMHEVKRFYTITPKDTETIRAWQGHRIEEKWFHVLQGRFLIGLVKIDDWETPSDSLKVEKFILSTQENQVLHIPKGYANGFRALEDNAQLLVFSSTTLAEAAHDNYRFDAQKWCDWTI